MSILKSLKGTFRNVQEDISGSLKSLTVSPEKGKTQDSHFHFSSTVNYDGGAEILHKNQNIWKDLYAYSEENSIRAQNVDIQIGNLFVYCDKQSESLMKLHEESSRLPSLITQLQTITDSLALVEEEYDKVEAALVHLENLCEEQEFQRNTASHHKQLAVYKMKKEHELQRYRARLAAEHAHKVEQVNKKRQNLLHEKQEAYNEQFAQDVDYFKKHGKPGRLPSTPESEKKLDLAEVEIDEDPEALDAFLQSDDTPSPTEAKDNTEENSVESTEKTETEVEVLSDILSPSDSVMEMSKVIDTPEENSLPEVASPDLPDQSGTDLPLKENIKDVENQSDSQTDSKELPQADQSDKIETEDHSIVPEESAST
ncbi:dysbindin-like [Ruditapes philippinarum]|uniref:dysbindin-like n=1 Tax=Ruditapes philippinarum TaxID=129788 RepID=UPI00295C38D1|nr:dysbindin-like [Ruditapes philippinarum]